MKETLRGRMENMLCRITGRAEMLERSIKQYLEEKDYENAMKCDIKLQTLILVEEDLRKQLQS